MTDVLMTAIQTVLIGVIFWSAVFFLLSILYVSKHYGISHKEAFYYLYKTSDESVHHAHARRLGELLGDLHDVWSDLDQVSERNSAIRLDKLHGQLFITHWHSKKKSEYQQSTELWSRFDSSIGKPLSGSRSRVLGEDIPRRAGDIRLREIYPGILFRGRKVS